MHIAAAAECCGLAKAEGVSPQLVYDLIAGAAGSSAQFNLYFPDMFREEFTTRTKTGEDTLKNAIGDLVSDICVNMLGWVVC